MKVELKAYHYKQKIDTIDPYSWVIATAVKDDWPDVQIHKDLQGAWIDGDKINHGIPYNEYFKDYKRAFNVGFTDFLIRTIELPETESRLVE